MTYRHIAIALLSALLLCFGQSLAHAAECPACSRNLTDCQKPAHSTYVNCMKGSNTSCSSKCATDCQGKKEVQKCTFDCSKACGGSASCQATFTTASAQCINSYKTCKNGCT